MRLSFRILALLVVGVLLVAGLAAYQDRITAQREAETDAEYLACKLRECGAQRIYPGCNLRCDEPGAAVRVCGEGK